MPQDERHHYGQHYTPREVAKFLAAFAVRRADDLVFAPSCGDGRLLAEALRLKRELSPRTNRASRVDEVFGVDRSASAIELATGSGARVARADFFDIDPGQSLAKGRRSNNQVTLPSEFD